MPSSSNIAPLLAVPLSAATLRRATLRLELHEHLGHLIIRPLRQNAQYRPAGLVELNAPTERTPAGARALVDHVLDLHHGDANEAVLAHEVVVLDADVQLVRRRLVLVTHRTVTSRDV